MSMIIRDIMIVAFQIHLLMLHGANVPMISITIGLYVTFAVSDFMQRRESDEDS